MKLVEVFLGIMTALGGFVDVGELVFVAQAGAKYAYACVWVIAFGTIGIIAYSEMAGRIAAVKKQAVFDVVPLRLGKLGIVVLLLANAVNLITCSAEIGGVAITLRLLFGLPMQAALLLGTLTILALVAILPFQWIERTFGLLGLCMLVFAAATVRLHPDWGAIAHALIPRVPPEAHGKEFLVWLYFVVGIFSSVMMAYEVYFYSSGGIEDEWKPADTWLNTVIAGVGSALGALLAIAILALGKLVFQPHGIVPDSIDSVALATAVPLGKLGLTLGLLGILFAIAGAAAEVSLSAAYNYAQYFGLPWGRKKSLRAAPRFNLVWAAFLVAGMLVMMTGVDPIHLVEYSVIFSAAVLPLTYWPILRHSSDPAVMGEHANSRFVTVVGWVFLVLVTIAAVLGVPLMFLTHAGQG